MIRRGEWREVQISDVACLYRAAKSLFEVNPFGLRRDENRQNRQHCVDHHHAPDIDIGLLNSVGAQDHAGENRDQSAAVDLRDLITCVCARSAKRVGKLSV